MVLPLRKKAGPRRSTEGGAQQVLQGRQTGWVRPATPVIFETRLGGGVITEEQDGEWGVAELKRKVKKLTRATSTSPSYGNMGAEDVGNDRRY